MPSIWKGGSSELYIKESGSHHSISNCLCYFAYATSHYYFHVADNYIHRGEVDLMIGGGVKAVVIHPGLKGFVPLPQRNDDS